MHPIAFLALDIAEDRTREAELRHRNALARGDLPGRPSWPRRALANAFALVSRGSARVAHRIDEYVVEDQPRTLASTK